MSLFICKKCYFLKECKHLQCDDLWNYPQKEIDMCISKDICPDCGKKMKKSFYERDGIKDFFFYHECSNCGHEFDLGQRRYRKFGELVPIYSTELLKKEKKLRMVK